MNQLEYAIGKARQHLPLYMSNGDPYLIVLIIEKGKKIPVYVCYYCNRTFSTEEALAKHLSSAEGRKERLAA